MVDITYLFLSDYNEIKIEILHGIELFKHGFEVIEYYDEGTGREITGEFINLFDVY